MENIKKFRIYSSLIKPILSDYNELFTLYSFLLHRLLFVFESCVSTAIL